MDEQAYLQAGNIWLSSNPQCATHFIDTIQTLRRMQYFQYHENISCSKRYNAIVVQLALQHA